MQWPKGTVHGGKLAARVGAEVKCWTDVWYVNEVCAETWIWIEVVGKKSSYMCAYMTKAESTCIYFNPTKRLLIGCVHL